MLTQNEMEKLKAACLRLPETAVQTEEEHVADSPLLILMSTVLSLNRRWYKHALPARQHFEEHVYKSLVPKTLVRFREFIGGASSNRTDWAALAQALWQMNEWDKARMLSELVDCFIVWREKNAPGLEELEALRKWARSTPKEQFVGCVKGLGPRAYEQLLWYLEGKEAIKLDRHVSNFVYEVVGRPVGEDEKLHVLRAVASQRGISATELDARIWDHMQSREKKAAGERERQSGTGRPVSPISVNALQGEDEVWGLVRRSFPHLESLYSCLRSKIAERMPHLRAERESGGEGWIKFRNLRPGREAKRQYSHFHLVLEKRRARIQIWFDDNKFAPAKEAVETKDVESAMHRKSGKGFYIAKEDQIDGDLISWLERAA